MGAGSSGRHGPAVQAGAGASTVARWRSRSASGQAAAKARRTRASGLANAGAELEQAQPDRRELGPGEAMAGRDGVSHGEHQPVGCGVQDEPHLVGGRMPAGGAVGGELALVLEWTAPNGIAMCQGYVVARLT